MCYQAQQAELRQSEQRAEDAEARNAGLTIELQQAKVPTVSQLEVHFSALPAAISPAHLMKVSLPAGSRLTRELGCMRQAANAA